MLVLKSLDIISIDLFFFNNINQIPLTSESLKFQKQKTQHTLYQMTMHRDLLTSDMHNLCLSV